MNQPRVIDVSGLPTFAFGSRSPLWWGTLCIMVVEGSMFLFGLISYFYLQGTQYEWPPGANQLPGVTFATINTVILLLSIWPNHLVKKAATNLELEKVQKLLLVMSGAAVVFLVIRAFEFTQLEIRWNDNAYGSILWVMLGLHTVHLLTDAFDTMVMAAMMYRKPVEGRRFVDVSENAEYWYFVIVMWLPIYFAVYLYPRM